MSRTTAARPTRRATLALAALLAFARAAAGSAPDTAPEVSGETRERGPEALAFGRDGARLVVANRRSGSLSVIDPAAARVVAEHRVGRGPVALAPLPDGTQWLVLDRDADALLVVRIDPDGRGARVVHRLGLPRDPAGLALDERSGRAVVASLASQRLSVLAVGAGTSRPDVALSVALPFPPRRVAIAPGGALAVAADAYGGRLAVVPLDGDRPPVVRSLPAQNIRGLAITPDGATLLLTYQELSPSARADFEGVHWGRLLNNHLRTLRLDAVASATTDDRALDGSLVSDLGSFGNGAADPGGMALHPTGGVAVALSGVDEVSIGPYPTDLRRRARVGARPVDVAFAPDGRTVYSADALGDTVTAIEVPLGARRATIALGRRPEPTPVSLGERLFYSASLSHDRWLSCHSCHADGHTTGGLADTLGDRSYGAPKLIPSLLGVAETGPWAWNGSVERLEDQVRKSVISTMQGDPPTDDQVVDLTTYLRSLAPARPPAPEALAAAVARGRAVFEARSCANCHAPPSYTTPEVFDVGLADERGRRRFNPPSLRGVGLRAPFLHDGRARSLADVFLEHQHPKGTRWDPAEVADLTTFLRSL